MALGLFVAPYLKIVFQPSIEAVPEKVSFVKSVPGYRLLFGGDLGSFATSSAPLSSSSQNPAGILQDLPAGAIMVEKFPWAALTCFPALLGIILAICAPTAEKLTEYSVYLTGINVIALCSFMVPFMTILQGANTPSLISNLQYSMQYRVAWGLCSQFGVALVQLGAAVTQYYYQRLKNARDKKMNLARFQFKKTSIKDNTTNDMPALSPAAGNAAIPQPGPNANPNANVNPNVSYPAGAPMMGAPIPNNLAGPTMMGPTNPSALPMMGNANPSYPAAPPMMGNTNPIGNFYPMRKNPLLGNRFFTGNPAFAPNPASNLAFTTPTPANIPSPVQASANTPSPVQAQPNLIPGTYPGSLSSALAGAEGEFALQVDADLGPDEANDEPFRLALPHEELSATDPEEVDSNQQNEQKEKTFLAINQKSLTQSSAAQNSVVQRSIAQGSFAKGPAPQGPPVPKPRTQVSVVQRAIAQGAIPQAQGHMPQPSGSIPQAPASMLQGQIPMPQAPAPMSQGQVPMPQASATMSQPMTGLAQAMSTFANQRRQSQQIGLGRSSLAILRQTQLSKSLADEAAKAASEIKLQDETVKGMQMSETLTGADSTGLSDGEKLLASFLPGAQRSGEQKTATKPIGSYAMIDMDGATGANEIFMSASARDAENSKAAQGQPMSEVVLEGAKGERMAKGEAKLPKDSTTPGKNPVGRSAQPGTQSETKPLAKAGPGVHKKW